MKRLALITVLLIFISLTILSGCSNSSHQLQATLNDYSKIFEEGIPEGLNLTIYYVDPTILTNYPWSKDNLIAASDVTKIVIEHDELAAQWKHIQEMDLSVLQPALEESYVNARIYYVLGTREDKILEVVLNGIHDFDSSFVNDIAVENHTVLYEILRPFLTEDDCKILGI